jgi:hypothetical protein
MCVTLIRFLSQNLVMNSQCEDFILVIADYSIKIVRAANGQYSVYGSVIRENRV